jgi:PASTA domain
VTEPPRPAGGWYQDEQGRWRQGPSQAEDPPAPQTPVAAQTPLERPSGPPPPSRGGVAPPQARRGFWRWIAEKPRAAFWITLVSALVVGLGIGLAASDSSDLERERDSLRGQVSSLRSERDELDQQLESAQDEVAERESELETAQERISELTARGEVPSFTGGTVDDAEAKAADYEWEIRTTERPTSSNEPGTVIAQSPRPGTVLKAGRVIRLVVAKAPPPSWKTIAVLTGGGGASKTDEFRVPNGTVRLVYNLYTEGNAALILYRRPAEYIDLLVNEIGTQQGSTRLYEPGIFYLDVTADTYRIEIQQYR